MNALPPNPGADPAAALPEGVQRLSIVADLPLFPDLATHCYLIETGDGTMVIDPPSHADEALDRIETAARSPITAIVVTHTHPDHVGGVAALAARTGATVHAHPAARPHLPSGLTLHPLEADAVLAGWTVWHVPGHRADHLCLIEPERRIAVVGDLVAGAGTVIINPPDGHMGQYLAALERLRAADLALLLPGHGPLVVEPRRLLDMFITHRLEREQKVLSALDDTPRSLSALLPIAYDDTSPALYGLAKRSLLAHLIKLQEEGRAAREERGWRRPSTQETTRVDP